MIKKKISRNWKIYIFVLYNFKLRYGQIKHSSNTKNKIKMLIVKIIIEIVEIVADMLLYLDI